MNTTIEIYQSADNQTTVKVRFEGDTVWLSQKLMAEVFEKDSDTIGLHLKNIYTEGELEEHTTTEFFSVVQQEGSRTVKRKTKFYNLDAVISVGYRVNSKRGTQFRQWATRRLKEYLVQGYAINEQRLAEKQMQVETLKTGIRILSRAIEDHAGRNGQTDSKTLHLFAKGLTLLDDYDHEALDDKGRTLHVATYPTMEEYMDVIGSMKSKFASDVFAKPKDAGFDSAVHQIRQSFGVQELYPSIEEKAATLLYLIVKNHAFVDGNKRIGAACFVYFLERNNLLWNSGGKPIISNDALASLTLFVASSKAQEMKTVKRVILSMLNRT
jgi:prophage maintenance system killer protein